MDGSKEHTLGKFNKKYQEAYCHIRQTDPHSPWQNSEMRSIRELKKGAGRKMVRVQDPKKIWDHALEYEAYVRSNTAHDIYILKGEVPETVMSGETSNISQFAQLAFYQLVMFRDKPIQFIDKNLVLGRYIGPSLDVGPAMTANITKENGEVVHRSTYDALTKSEAHNVAHISRRELFDKKISVKLGPDVPPDDFPEINLEHNSL